MNRTFTPVKPATALKSVFLAFIFTALMGNWAWGQVYLIDPAGDGGFETGTTFAANGWSVTTSGTATDNQFVCNTGATTGFSGARCAYVTNNTASTPPPHTYTVSATRVTHIYRNFTIPAGATNINLDFRWIGSGEGTAYDRMRIWVVPTTYTPAYGTEITATGTAPTGNIQYGLTNYNLQATWINATTITLPNSYAGAGTFRLVFEWRNDNSVGTNPPIGVDNISLTYTAACTAPTTQATIGAYTNNTTGNSVTVNWTRGNGDAGVIVVARLTSTAAVDPVSGTSYTANATFGSGNTTGAGNFVVYKGTGTNVTVTGLTLGSDYTFTVYEYNGTGLCYKNPGSSGNVVISNCASPLAGTYTIGAGGGYSFTTITAAVAQLMSCGISAPVIFELKDATYSGSETFPITIGSVSGSSATNTVTFRPDAGVTPTISGSNATAIFDLNNADYIIFDGRQDGAGSTVSMTVSNTNTSGSAFRFINDATYDILRYCNIKSVNTSTSSGTVIFSTTTGTTGNDNNTIEYCSIYDGTTAPYVGIYSSGTTTSTTHYNSNNTISNNKIYNFINPAGSDGWDTPAAGVFNTGSDFGIKLSVGTTAWTISGNSFYQNKSTTPYSNGTTATHYAINITNSTGTGFVVENNYIGGSAANCAGSAWTINQNTIKSNFTAIHLDVGVSSLSTINHNVIDNISVSTSAQGTSQDAPFIGILVRGYLDVSYNTLGGTSGIFFSSVSAAADFDGIYQFDESANAIGTYTTNNNSISNITISNTSGANANVYLLRAYSKNYQTTWTCNNNTIGGTTANSINCQNYHWVHGIFFSWGTSISASGNTIQNITCANSGIHGIKEQSDAGGATTSSTYSCNTIKTIKCLSGQVNGILLDGGNSTNNLIERNLIYDLNGVTVTAINHSNSRSPFTDVIRNNMIALGNSVATSTTRGIRYESSSGTCNIYHNSVYLHGSSTTTYCMEKATAATACNVKNNIFYNNCSSGAKYALYYSETTGLTSDCNDLYVPSAQTGYAPSTGYTTLANWQAGTVYDDNSVSIDPGFLSITAPYNLHVDSGIKVVNCTGLVTNDFDNEARAIPHMGADEAPITLPVSLLRFDASCNEDGVMVLWSTATETNNNYFTLERSADLNVWSFVAKVQGAGNSNTLLNYSYADKNPLRGLTYYRLTQTDFNGGSETFDPVMVRCDESLAEVSCYPNPFSDQLVVTLQNIGAEQGSLVLRDVTGRVIMQRELSADDFSQQSVSLSLSGIASGVYSLEFSAGSYEKTMRVVKNK